jgi:hypothetical protein
MNQAEGLRVDRALAGTVAATLVLALPLPASAYVGPGAGLSAIGALLALLAAVFVAIVGFVWYPVKRLLGRRKAAASADTASGAASTIPPAAGRSDDEKR